MSVMRCYNIYADATSSRLLTARSVRLQKRASASPSVVVPSVEGSLRIPVTREQTQRSNRCILAGLPKPRGFTIGATYLPRLGFRRIMKDYECAARDAVFLRRTAVTSLALR